MKVAIRFRVFFHMFQTEKLFDLYCLLGMCTAELGSSVNPDLKKGILDDSTLLGLRHVLTLLSLCSVLLQYMLEGYVIKSKEQHDLLQAVCQISSNSALWSEKCARMVFIYNNSIEKYNAVHRVSCRELHGATHQMKTELVIQPVKVERTDSIGRTIKAIDWNLTFWRWPTRVHLTRHYLTRGFEASRKRYREIFWLSNTPGQSKHISTTFIEIKISFWTFWLQSYLVLEASWDFCMCCIYKCGNVYA